MFYQLFAVLLARFFLTIGFFTIHRIFFLLLNFHSFYTIDFQKTIYSLLLGIRFDISTFWIFCGIWMILSAIPVHLRYETTKRKIVEFLAAISHGLVCSLNITDAEYFKFTGKRLTWQQWLSVKQDALEQIPNLILHYWYIVLLIVVISWLYITAFRKISLYQVTYPSSNPAYFFTFLPLLIISSIIGIRGGIQLKPLQMGEAYRFAPPQLGALTLNTPFSLVQSFEKRKSALEMVQLVSESEQKDWQQRSLYGLPDSTAQKTNIVILILESFSAEYIGFMNGDKRYTPFLDSLSKTSIWFPNAYANGRTSIDAIPSLLAGLPHLMEEHFIASVYHTNHIGGIGNTLKKHGYTTAFFHGGKNGTMGFDMFARQNGFEYYGKNEFDKEVPDAERHYDGAWGIYDDVFMMYMLQKLSSFQKPFCAVLFTLSSHAPYRLPTYEWFKYPKGTLPIHESIGYVDNALKKFFEKASQNQWFKNTLFIITADHTQETDDPKYVFLSSRYKIPFMMYYPKGFSIFPDTSKLVQQIDLPATICDWLGLHHEKVLPFGTSVFSRNESPAITFIQGNYYAFQKNFYAVFKENHSMFFNISDIAIQPNEECAKTEMFLKNAIQYHHNNMIKDSFYER